MLYELEYECRLIGAIMAPEMDGDIVGAYTYRHTWTLIEEILQSVKRIKGEDAEQQLIREFGLRYHGFD